MTARKPRRSLSRPDVSKSPRCSGCGGLLAVDEKKAGRHSACADRGPIVARVMVAMDQATLDALDELGPTRSGAIRYLAREWRRGQQ